MRELIVDYLYETAPDEVSPKTLSSVLGLNHKTVKKELSRLLDGKDVPIVRTSRGWYRHKMDIDVLARLDRTKRIELHGIKLEGTCLQVNAGYSLATKAKQRYRKRGIYKEVFEGRIVTVTIHEMGLVEVFLKTSETPMNFPQFDRFQSWLKGLLDFVSPSSWKIIQIGLNVDIPGLTLEGLKSIKLDAFRNAWFQIYQKGEDTVRFETHVLPDIRLHEAILLMRQLLEPRGELSYDPAPFDGDDPAVR